MFDAREGRAGAAVRSVRGSRAHSAHTSDCDARDGDGATRTATGTRVERGKILLTRQSSLCGKFTLYPV